MNLNFIDERIKWKQFDEKCPQTSKTSFLWLRGFFFSVFISVLYYTNNHNLCKCIMNRKGQSNPIEWQENSHQLVERKKSAQRANKNRVKLHKKYQEVRNSNRSCYKDWEYPKCFIFHASCFTHYQTHLSLRCLNHYQYFLLEL